MKMKGMQWRLRAGAWFAVMALGVMYAWVTAGLEHHTGVEQAGRGQAGLGQTVLGRPSATGAVPQTASPIAAGVGQSGQGEQSPDVPDAVVETIASALAPVAGVTELVVQSAGQGYDVAAEVDLGAYADAALVAAAHRDVDVFFPAVYRLALPIENARIYFFVDGRLTGGAELPRQAYRQTMAANSARPGDLAAVLAKANGADGAWFFVQGASGMPTM
ncbi:hypothetical protein GCM10010885_12220 [Alicyclobacillus cellulosilyticus]|uniref:Uncharacterized protein n=1 Tax=Alicyclobacillus cellulosilyticus TaxID=1003997 RepID=A0A917K9B0_9BACL|nr:hypothetical protein [Alicyclobacillus cellulosilyticus]GGJ04583.1 hypothetical protein GCM10010885_12220 [Alicyclobacillus cellulosilyticus]